MPALLDRLLNPPPVQAVVEGNGQKATGTLQTLSWESGLTSASTGWQWLAPVDPQHLLRGYALSPWPHIKLVRQCSAIAMLEFQIKARGGREPRLLPEDYPLWTLLRDPNPMMTEWDFRFLTELYVRATGEAYWRIIRDRFRRPERLWIYPKFWVKVERDRATRQVLFYTVQNPSERVEVQDMIWLHTPDPMDPYVQGVGDMLALATEIETFEYASESDRNFFLKDASPTTAITVPGNPLPEERTRIRQEFGRRHGSFRNYGEPALLWGGMEIANLRNTRREMDFVEGQKFLRDVIIAGVHPHILGISEDVNRANAEAAEYTFSKWELWPRARWWQAVINKFLAPQYDRRAFLEFQNVIPQDTDRLLRAALDPTTGELLKVNQRLELLNRALGGVMPTETPYGEAYVLSIARVPQTEDGEPLVEPAPPPEPEPEDEEDREPVGRAVAKQRDAEWIARVLGLPHDVARALLRHVRPAYEAVMRQRWEQAALEVGLETAFDVSNPRVAQFLRTQAAQRVQGITDTARDRLRSTLAEGVAAGEGIPDLAKRVRAAFEGQKASRSVVIARTETLEASNRSADIAYREAGVERKEWLLAPDYTPEIDGGECAEFDGRVVEMEQDFAPGVPYPPLHPQCRCTIAPVFVTAEGEERRLYADEVRKQHITALGRTHLRLERLYLNALRRGWGEYQTAVLRRLRREPED